MTDHTQGPDRRSGVEDIRAELGDELMRAARAHREPRLRLRGRRLGVAVAATVMVAVPASFAVAELLPSDEPMMIAVPPPLFAPAGEFGDCPKEARDSLLELKELSDYPETPGYPVAGCPTLEQIRANAPVAAELEAHGEALQQLAPKRSK